MFHRTVDFSAEIPVFKEKLVTFEKILFTVQKISVHVAYVQAITQKNTYIRFLLT